MRTSSRSAVIRKRRRPEKTLLCKTIADHWNSFRAEREAEGRHIPRYISEEFDNSLRCGILAHGFGRVHCKTCQTDILYAFSCRGRGFCPSCGARRMAQAANRLTDELIPLVPVLQYVVTCPPPLRLWLARSQNLAGKIFLRVWGALCEHLQKESGVHEGLTGGVMFVQRFGSGANLNVHLHIIVLDGDFYPD